MYVDRFPYLQVCKHCGDHSFKKGERYYKDGDKITCGSCHVTLNRAMSHVNISSPLTLPAINSTKRSTRTTTSTSASSLSIAAQLPSNIILPALSSPLHEPALKKPCTPPIDQFPPSPLSSSSISPPPPLPQLREFGLSAQGRSRSVEENAKTIRYVSGLRQTFRLSHDQAVKFVATTESSATNTVVPYIIVDSSGSS